MALSYAADFLLLTFYQLLDLFSDQVASSFILKPIYIKIGLTSLILAPPHSFASLLCYVNKVAFGREVDQLTGDLWLCLTVGGDVH